MIKFNIFIETDFDENSNNKFDKNILNLKKILTNTKKMMKHVLI